MALWIGKLIQTRNRVLKLYIDHLRSFLDDPLPYMDAGCIWHMQEQGRGTHRSAILELLQETLAPQRLFPIPEPTTYDYCVQGLYWSIEAIKEKLLKPADLRLGPHRLSCPGCEPYKRLFKRLREVRGDRPLVPLSESQKVYLARKRAESGVSHV